jgi:hypothetical protein
MDFWNRLCALDLAAELRGFLSAQQPSDSVRWDHRCGVAVASRVVERGVFVAQASASAFMF